MFELQSILSSQNPIHMETKIYRYTFSKWTSFFGVLLFGTGVFFMVEEARNNDRGLLLNNIIELSANGATIFYWVMALICFLVVLMLLILAVFSSNNQVITLTEQAIIAPKSGISKKILTIPYIDIIELKTQQVGSNRLLTITHSEGNLIIPQSMLPNKAAFKEMYELLRERTNQPTAI